MDYIWFVLTVSNIFFLAELCSAQLFVYLVEPQMAAAAGNLYLYLYISAKLTMVLQG